MKTTKKTTIGIRLMTGISVAILSMTGCTKETQSVTSNDNSMLKETLLNYTFGDGATGNCFYCIDSLPQEPLNTLETEALMIMREEEFLAHDVYVTLGQLYSKPVFRNIAQSEQRHTDAVKALIKKYGLPDPAENHTAGVFQNEVLQNLYNSLVSQGAGSLINALTVGATIEDLDITDLKNHLLNSNNADIAYVFNNLMRGSRNHLRAFYANIIFSGGSYAPQYLTQDEFDAITGSIHETGNGHCQ